MLPARSDSINYLNSLSEYYYTTRRYDSVLVLATRFKEHYTNASTALISTAYLALSKFALKADYEIELTNLNKAFVALDRDQRYPGDQLSFAYYTRSYIASKEGKLDDAYFWGNKAYNQDLYNEDYIAIAYDLELLAGIAEKRGKIGDEAELFKRAADSYFAVGIEGHATYTEVKSLIHRLNLKGDNPFLKNRLKHLKDKVTDKSLLPEINKLLLKQ
ncbi:MAG: hypothetical protein IPJ75_04250 [Ignavibacteriales bacterium]|nr:hypothetical protein [Ignavibacteriales bacterium]